MKRQLGITDETEFALFLFVVILIAWLLVGLAVRLYITHYLKLHVTSWWRSFGKNLEVGGVSNSLHLVGMAWDVVPATYQNQELLRDAGLKVINEGDHLHAQIL